MRLLPSLPWLAICLLPGIFQSTSAQIDPNDKDHGVRWVYPLRAEDYTFHYMDTVEVEWTSYFDQPLLYTFCSLNGQPVEKSQGYAEAFNGSKTVLLDWTDAGPPCWFNLRPNTSTGYGSNSNTWGYDLAQRSQPVTLGADISSTATTSAPTSSTTIATDAATTASTGETSSTTTSDATDATSSSTSSSSSKQLGVGAQAGIGVAAGAAGIGLGVLGAILWMRRRKRQKGMVGGDSAYAGLPAQVYSGYDYKGYSSRDGRWPVSPPPPATDSHYGGPALPGYAEMANTAPRPELDADRPAAELSAAYHGR